MYSAAVDPASIGQTFTAVFGAPGGGQQGVYVWFSSPSSIVIDSVSGPGPLTGKVPDGAETVSFGNCAVTGTSVTYTAQLA
jgi:hypothetical protein